MSQSPLLRRVRNRVERVRQRRWRMAAYSSAERHIVMGGAPRSGTTVLRKVFDRHPEICSGAETKLFVPAAYNLEWLAESYDLRLDTLIAMRDGASSQAAFIDAFAAQVRQDAGKARWAEKTPQNIRNLDWIMARYPKAAIIHIIRDGRDVVCSMRQHPDWRWVDGAWQKVLVPRSVEWYAQRWLADTTAGLAWRDDSRYVEVRYEDLIADPTSVLRSICLGIGARVDAEWLAEVGQREHPGTAEVGHTKRPDYEGAVSGASVGRWREDLSADEQREVERLCGPQLRELGYEA
jgi:protein-tyrosine sulfotransferase